MDKKKFIDELSFLLQDINQSDRDEAIEFYENFFDEAGEDNEQQVINELGSPEKVAAIIKAGLDSTFDDGIEYGDAGVDNGAYNKSDEIIEATIVDEKDSYKKPTTDIDRNFILKIIIVVLACIVLLPVGGGVGGLFVGFLGVCFALIVVGFVGSIACLVAFISLLIQAITLFSASSIPAGFLVLGIGLLMVPLSYLTISLSNAIVRGVPKLIRASINACKRLIEKVGA